MRLRDGLSVTAVARLASIVSQAALVALLARLLDPSEFGMVAVLNVFIVLFNLLADFGLSSAVVQYRDLGRRGLGVLYTISLGIALSLSLLFAGLGPLFARVYGRSDYVVIALFLSLSVFFYSASVVPIGKLRRDSRFALLGKTTAGATILSGVVACIAALFGFGYFSLILKSLVHAFVQWLSVTTYARIRPCHRSGEMHLKSILKYSGFQMAFALVNYGARNIDKPIIGLRLGERLLGGYDQAYRLVSLPVLAVNQVLSTVLHPYLVGQQNSSALPSSFIALVRATCVIGFPMGLFLSVSSEELVTLILGQEWVFASAPFAAFSSVLGVQLFIATLGSAYLALERTDLLFVTGLISAGLLIAGLAIGLWIGGVEVVAWLHAAAIVLSLIVRLGFLRVFVPRLELQRLLMAILPCSIASGVLAVGWVMFASVTSGMAIVLSLGLRCLVAVVSASVAFWISGDLSFLYDLFRSIRTPSMPTAQ